MVIESFIEDRYPNVRNVKGKPFVLITETIAEAPERLEEAVEITDVEIGEGTMRIGGRCGISSSVSTGRAGCRAIRTFLYQLQ